MNRLLSEDEFKVFVGKKVESLLSFNKLTATDVSNIAKPDKPNSLVNTIGLCMRGQSAPSLYSFYCMVYAIPGLNPSEIFMARNKGYANAFENPMLAAEPETTYEVIKPWAQEKMALLERINDMSDELRRCYKENRELREKLSDTRP